MNRRLAQYRAAITAARSFEGSWNEGFEWAWAHLPWAGVQAFMRTLNHRVAKEVSE